MTASPAPRKIALRWRGRCVVCSRELPSGTRAWHDPTSRSVTCVACHTAGSEPAPAAAGVSVPPPRSAEPEPLEVGTPGAAARRKYDRLREEREAGARERLGRLGVAAVRIAGDPQHVSAWRKGADGEERAARRLQKHLRDTGVQLLHDRAVPMSLANIDHLAIGPGGVTVIDAKNVRGRPQVVRRGGILGKRSEHLLVGGRDRTSLVEGVESQVGEVIAALKDRGHPEVSVTGVLCWVRTDDLPTIARVRIREVALLGPRWTADVAARPGPLDPMQVAELAADLAALFPCR